jgi:hypothetical protein
MKYDKSVSVNYKLTFNSGINWLKKSFVVLREQPLQFIILEFFTILCSFLPFLGAFLQPLCIGRFLLLTSKVNRKQDILLKDIFSGLFSPPNLIRLAFINFLLNVALLFLNYIFKINSTNIVGILFFSVLPTIFITMLMWFAPALIIFDRLLPFRAMILSLKGISSNIFAMLIFSIVISAISLLIIVPFGFLSYWLWQHFHSVFIIAPIAILGILLWLIWGAILNITIYFAALDLFISYEK